jgi:hypothetical protein
MTSSFIYPQHISFINPVFLDWFIGFSEGDGCFFHLKYSHFFIISQKDPQVLYKIRKHLGFGSIKQYTDSKLNNTYFRYTVSGLDNIERLIHIFNGKLLLSKTQLRFSDWVSAYNLRPTIISQQRTISLVPPFRSVSFSNAWLSGFIDAEGCFSIVHSVSKDSYCFRFILDQKSESSFLHSLVLLFGSGRVDSRNECSDIHRFVLELNRKINLKKSCSFPKTDSFSAFLQLYQYLEKFPLFSSKHLVFLRFLKVWIRFFDSVLRSHRSHLRLLRLISHFDSVNPSDFSDLSNKSS